MENNEITSKRKRGRPKGLTNKKIRCLIPGSKRKFIPSWLYNLPAGKYSLTELTTEAQKIKTSGITLKSSVFRTLKNLKVKKELRPMGYSNLSESIYDWKGIK